MSSHALPAKSLMAMIILAIFVSPMAMAKKPPKDPPEPTAPVEYHLTWIDPLVYGANCRVGDMNNQGFAVGGSAVTAGQYAWADRRAIVWTAPTGTVDMNTLSNFWFDLDTNTNVDGWVAASAGSINEANQIVGIAVKDDFRRTFYYEDGVGFYLLPYPSNLDPAINHPRQINEDGVVIGWYVVNEYFTHPYIWNPDSPGILHIVDVVQEPLGINSSYFLCNEPAGGTSVELYSFSFDANGLIFNLESQIVNGASIWHGLNNNDCYVSTTQVSRREKAIELHSASGDQITIFQRRVKPLGEIMGGLALNDSGDVYYHFNDEFYLYRALEETSFDLVNMLDDSSKAEYLLALSGEYSHVWIAVLTDDDMAGVPADDPYDTICGVILTPPNYPADRTFVLTPVELP